MEASTSKKPPRGMLLISNLPALQNLVKRDPDGYAAEFATQWDHYDSLRRVIELGLGAGEASGPGSVAGTRGSGTGKGRRETEDKFREVVGFLCQTAPCYATKSKPVRPVRSLPEQISSLLLNRHEQLGPDTRKALVSGLIRLRSRSQGNGMLTDAELLKTLFPLLSMTTSSSLRSSILKTILTDIKHANLKSKNHKLNRMVQGLLFNMIERGLESNVNLEGTGVRGQPKLGKAAAAIGGREAMWAVKLASELWRKRVWDDAKTVQIVASACFHSHTKVQSAAFHFFLAETDSSGLVDSDEEEGEEVDVRQVKHVQTINKKRTSSDRKAKQVIKAANKKKKVKDAAAASGSPNFSALQLLQDPESFGERLYDSLLRNDKRYTFEHKLVIMQLFSRVSGTHKLQVLGFYSYILRYLARHQLQVTAVLAVLAQSVHELTPPDALTPCLRKIANEFVHPGVAAEVHAAGLNAIREICRRQPWAMEADLLEDLVEYRKSKDKGVMVASRGLLALYREVNPSLLKRRERGKAASMRKPSDQVDLPRFGEANDTRGIAGLGLLEEALAENHGEGEEDDEAAWNGWEVDSDVSSESGGWIDVSDEGEVLDISDSSDDEEPRKERMAKRRKIAVGSWKEGEAQSSGDESASGDEKEGSEDGGPDDGRSENDEEAESDEAESDDEAEDETVKALEKETDLVNSVAATRILTPADYAKLNELREKALEQEASHGGGAPSKRKLAALKAARKAAADGDDDHRFVSEGDIIGVQKKAKQDYETRMASIQAGRDGREKFGSKKIRGRQGMKNGAQGSSTNEAKARGKAFAMTQHSHRVRSKKGASLRDRQKTLRAHIDRKKRGGRRGNG